MILGVGIDTVRISEMERLMERVGGGFVRRTFTSGEVEQADTVACPAEYFSTRFAVKEAAFKALAHLTAEKGFDFRKIETFNDENGCPHIRSNEIVQSLIKEIGIFRLHVSITTESDFATAIVIAEL